MAADIRTAEPATRHARCTWRSAGSISIASAPPTACVNSRPHSDSTRRALMSRCSKPRPQPARRETTRRRLALRRASTLNPNDPLRGVHAGSPSVSQGRHRIWRAAHTTLPGRAKHAVRPGPSRRTDHAIHRAPPLSGIVGRRAILRACAVRGGFAASARQHAKAIERSGEASMRDPLAAGAGVEAARCTSGGGIARWSARRRSRARRRRPRARAGSRGGRIASRGSSTLPVGSSMQRLPRAHAAIVEPA